MFAAICGNFSNARRRISISCSCARKGPDHEFTEPVALSSTVPREPSASAYGPRERLRPTRAPCSVQERSYSAIESVQGRPRRLRCNLRAPRFPHFHGSGRTLGTTRSTGDSPRQVPSGHVCLRLDITLLLVHGRRTNAFERGLAESGYDEAPRWRSGRTSSCSERASLRRLVEAGEERGRVLQSELNDAARAARARRARDRRRPPRARDAPDRGRRRPRRGRHRRRAREPLPRPIAGRRRPTRCSSSCARPAGIRC